MKENLLEGFSPMEPPLKRRKGFYEELLEEFHESEHACMGRKFEGAKDAQRFYSSLAYAARKTTLPVKASKAGCMVYLIRVDGDE